jgi:hypothetical protein
MTAPGDAGISRALRHHLCQQASLVGANRSNEALAEKNTFVAHNEILTVWYLVRGVAKPEGYTLAAVEELSYSYETAKKTVYNILGKRDDFPIGRASISIDCGAPVADTASFCFGAAVAGTASFNDRFNERMKSAKISMEIEWGPMDPNLSQLPFSYLAWGGHCSILFHCGGGIFTINHTATNHPDQVLIARITAPASTLPEAKSWPVPLEVFHKAQTILSDNPSVNKMVLWVHLGYTGAPRLNYLLTSAGMDHARIINFNGRGLDTSHISTGQFAFGQCTCDISLCEPRECSIATNVDYVLAGFSANKDVAGPSVFFLHDGLGAYNAKQVAAPPFSTIDNNASIPFGPPVDYNIPIILFMIEGCTEA